MVKDEHNGVGRYLYFLAFLNNTRPPCPPAAPAQNRAFQSVATVCVPAAFTGQSSPVTGQRPYLAGPGAFRSVLYLRKEQLSGRPSAPAQHQLGFSTVRFHRFLSAQSPPSPHPPPLLTPNPECAGPLLYRGLCSCYTRASVYLSPYSFPLISLSQIPLSNIY